MAEPLSYPAVGITERGLSHAARPGDVPQHGWGRAMCDSRLYISIEHQMAMVEEGHWQSVPLRATSASAPTLSLMDRSVIAEGVDCNRCTAALAKWEREHPQAKED